ncbi:30S ribosomal protein S8 [Candidatus Dependentiae bacterium]
MSIDVVGDFLTIIRNALSVSKRSTMAPYSKLKEEIARTLKEEGYIRDYKKISGDGPKSMLRVDLKYVGGESVIHEIKRMSRPGRRYYKGTSQLDPVIGGLGVAIVSTSSGVMTDRRARELSMGGEVICSVW